MVGSIGVVCDVTYYDTLTVNRIQVVLHWSRITFGACYGTSSALQAVRVTRNTVIGWSLQVIPLNTLPYAAIVSCVVYVVLGESGIVATSACCPITVLALRTIAAVPPDVGCRFAHQILVPRVGQQ